MADDTYTIEIKATGNAKVFLKDVSEQAEKTNDTIQKGFKESATAFEVFQGTLASQAAVGAFNALISAGQALFNQLGQTIQAANIQEEAVNNLNTALALAGDFSREASEGFREFAAEIEATTTVGDEAVISQLALAKSFGVTNEEAQALVKAAIDLSAATGISLDSAVKNLGKTYSGLTGELGESLPLIRTLTAEQLKAGDAIRLVGERFAGAAAAQTNTFSGAVQQLGNTFGTLQENLGAAITQNQDFITVINTANDILGNLAQTVANNGAVFRELGSVFLVGVAETLKVVIELTDVVTKQFLKFAGTLQVLYQSFVNGGLQIASFFNSDLKEAVAKSKEEIDKMNATIKSITQDTTAESIVAEINKIEDAVLGVSRSTNEAEKSVTETLNEQAQARKSINDQAQDEFKTRVEEELATLQKANETKIEQRIAFLERAKEIESLNDEQRQLIEEELSLKRQERIKIEQDAEAKKVDLFLKQKDLEARKSIASDAQILNSRINTLRKIEQNQKLSADKRVQIEQQRVNLEIQQDRLREQAGRTALGNLASFQTAKTKELAVLGKTAAVAQTTIDTYKGAQLAFNSLAAIPVVGVPLGIAAAAAAVAAGLGRVAQISGTPLQTGLTEVPAGFPNDTFAARLTSGERVVNAPQNRDLTSFLSDANGLGKKLDTLIKITEQNNQPIIVNIGGEEIVNVLQSELDGGRTVVL